MNRPPEGERVKNFTQGSICINISTWVYLQLSDSKGSLLAINPWENNIYLVFVSYVREKFCTNAINLEYRFLYSQQALQLVYLGLLVMASAWIGMT